MRTFIAFTLPDEVANQIAEWQQQNMPEGVFPEPVTNLHMTLAFLGETPEELVPQINQILSQLDASQVTISGPIAYEEQAKLAFLTYQDQGGQAVWAQLNAALKGLTGYEPQFSPWLAHTTVWRYAPDHKPNVNLPLPSLTFSPTAVTLYQSVRNENGQGATYQHVGNVFDPIEPKLDQRIFNGETPKPTVINFIQKLYDKAFQKEFGFPNDGLVKLVLTGSLTTYQYSDSSDCDNSAFANYLALEAITGQDSDTIRKRLIALNIDHLDGTFLPGGSHPIQVFTTPVGIQPEDVVVKGVRSGWDYQSKEWIVPPEKERVHDIQIEYPEVYRRAAAMADKMTEMLDARNYDTALKLWTQIHKKRQLDQQHGGGDFSEGNIVYKFLVHEGIVQRLRDEMHLQIETKVVHLDTPPDEAHSIRTPNRVPWIYLPETDTMWVGTAGSSHMEMMYLDDAINDETGSYERAWEGCYIITTKDAVIYSQYDNEYFNPEDIPQPLVDALHEAFGEISSIEYPDIDGDMVRLAAIPEITIKVIYDPQLDHIILGTQADVQPGHAIIGEYKDGIVTLQRNQYQFMNANYFRRLWAFSFPDKPLYEVHLDQGIDGNKIHLPTKPPRHVHMAATETSDPEINRLIEAFKDQTTQLLQGKLDHTDLREEGVAAGMCSYISKEFVKALNQEGYEAWLPSKNALESTPDNFGYTDRSISGAPVHFWSMVKDSSGQTWGIDWTAAQYGYKEWPMVQKLQDESWQREF